MVKQHDTTSKNVVPDFESEKGYYWMKQVYELKRQGSSVSFPYKQRQGLAQQSFFSAVDRRLSRSSTVVNISFDKEGKRVHE